METALARFSPDFRGNRDKIVKPKCCFSLFVMENWQVQEVQKMCEWINVASAVAIFVPRPANPRKENLWTLQQ